MVKPEHIFTGIFSTFAIALLSIMACEPHTRTSTSRTGRKIEIPFSLTRNKIILPVRVGDSRELKVILDTGMHFEGLLLYNKDLKDSITLNNEIEVQVPGAGADSASTAVMADSMTFLVGPVAFKNQRIIILKSETMKGFASDGVTGYSLFGNYIVEIDYDKMTLILHESKEAKVDSSWEWLPMTFKDNKIPWIEARVNIAGDKDIPISVYIDLASSDAIELLVKEKMKFELPSHLEDSYLGTGLSGDIHGQKGRIASFKLGSFYLEDVVTAFAPYAVRSKQEGADGIIGNNALRRFNCIFDYKNSRLYIKPNEYFSEPF